MKRRFLLIVLLILAGCQSNQETATPSASYQLTVVNGIGSGRYHAGETVHVWANPYPQGWTFDTWRGDIQPLPDVRSMHATMLMPERDMQIEATFKPIPIWSAEVASIADRDVYFYFPPEYRGVIFFFHGSGGDAREWSDLGAERHHFFDDAIAEGYAIVSVNSADRVNKQWDLTPDPASNADLEAVAAILTAFRRDGKISAQTPVYAVGMSQGGRFATLVAYALGMNASAVWVGAGHTEIMEVTTAPTLWCLADHDPIIDRDEVFSQYERLIERGVDAVYYVHSPMPIHALYFAGIEGVNEADSERLFTKLRSLGVLDEKNFLRENPRFLEWQESMGAELSESARRDIQDRLMVAYAEHAFYSDCDHRALDFFGSHP